MGKQRYFFRFPTLQAYETPTLCFYFGFAFFLLSLDLVLLLLNFCIAYAGLSCLSFNVVCSASLLFCFILLC